MFLSKSPWKRPMIVVPPIIMRYFSPSPPVTVKPSFS